MVLISRTICKSNNSNYNVIIVDLLNIV